MFIPKGRAVRLDLAHLGGITHLIQWLGGGGEEPCLLSQATCGLNMNCKILGLSVVFAHLRSDIEKSLIVLMRAFVSLATQRWRS